MADETNVFLINDILCLVIIQLSLLDLKLSEFVPVHDSQIRDVLFSPRGDGLTLTAGMDKALKLTSMHSNQVVQK